MCSSSSDKSNKDVDRTMAPLAERNVTIELPIEYTTPKTNVTYAVNYDEPSTGTKSLSTLDVESVLSYSENSENSRATNELNTFAQSLTISNLGVNDEQIEPDTVPVDVTIGAQPTQTSYQQPYRNYVRKGRKRRTVRYRIPRELSSMSRTRVRYDMQLVPVVKRNRSFLSRFPIWWMSSEQRKIHDIRLASSSSLSSFESHQSGTAPFEDVSSVVWIPSHRAEWEDSIHEMTSVCTSAAIRRHILKFGTASRKPFNPPLSKHYIRDRVDIDDPMEGYQIRCSKGGWLQGFILFTNFTTWNHGFKWDSRHPLSGISFPKDISSNIGKVDFDGSLADELEAQERSGDPQGTGIVFSQIAEIGLIGGLGCGEYLLRMALDRIYQKKLHKYVVLDAAEEAISFYEEFGFVRVGSICRYGKGLLPPEDDIPFSGYSHWTHANESKKSLRNRGGPSYMMCLKLPDKYGGLRNFKDDENPPFLSHMLELLVTEKPKIENLGTSTLVGQKQSRRSSTVSLDSSYSFDYSPRVTRKTTAKKVPINSEKDGNDVIAVALPSFGNSVEPPIERIINSFPHEKIQPALIELSPRSLPKRVSVVFPDGPTRNKKRRLDSQSLQLSTIHEAHLGSTVLRLDGSEAKSSLLTEKSFSFDHSDYTDKSIAATLLVPGVTKKIARTSNDALKGLKSSTLKQSLKKRMTAKSKAKKDRKLGRDQKSSKDSKDQTQKSYHSVRGPDGKFIRVSAVQDATIVKIKKSLSKVKNADKSYKQIDRTTLTKQKVKSYPRNRPHFYNRVVKPINGNEEFFFVLRYDEVKEELFLVPMGARGFLSGKREGRPRYQALVGDTDHNMFAAPAGSYQVVNAIMIMKTPFVASEAWDIEDS